MRKTILALALLLACFTITSCEGEAESYGTYYTAPSEYSESADDNQLLKLRIEEKVGTIDNYDSFYGSQSSAITWFNKICEDMEDPLFVFGLEVDDDSSVVMSLYLSNEYGDEDDEVVTHRTVTIFSGL